MDALIGFIVGFIFGGFAGVCLAAVVAMADGGDEE